MGKLFDEKTEELEKKIQNAYENGVTADEAEKLAGEFLHAQLGISKMLSMVDLDSRMRKTGVKAIRAAIYLEAASKGDKKPTEATLAAMVDSNALVSGEQEAFDKAEVKRDELERLYSVYTNAHIFYRGIAKGSFQ